MGLGDFLKSVGRAAAENMQDFAEKNREYQDKWESTYSSMSDEKLKEERRKFQAGQIYSSSHERAIRMGCLSQEMRNRGLIG